MFTQAWISSIIEILILAGGIVISWTKFGTKIALINQKLSEIEGNHLKHIEADAAILKESVQKMELLLARIDEKLKK